MKKKEINICDDLMKKNYFFVYGRIIISMKPCYSHERQGLISVLYANSLSRLIDFFDYIAVLLVISYSISRSAICSCTLCNGITCRKYKSIFIECLTIEQRTLIV